MNFWTRRILWKKQVGGSYQKGTTRYGNGFDFYGADVNNVILKENIIRRIYDVGFTIQRIQGFGKNVVVKNNAFVSNLQDSEIWENEAAAWIQSYEFVNNTSINVGWGWGMKIDQINNIKILQKIIE